MAYGIEIETTEGPLDVATMASMKIIKTHTITAFSNGWTAIPSGYTFSDLRLIFATYQALQYFRLTLNSATGRAEWFTTWINDGSATSATFHIAEVV